MGITSVVMETNKYQKEDRYLRAKKKVEAIKGFYWHLVVYLAVNGFITAFKVIRNMREGEAFVDAIWDIGMFFVWIPWGVGLLIHGLVVFDAFSFVLGKNWEERKLKELMEKDSNEHDNF